MDWRLKWPVIFQQSTSWTSPLTWTVKPTGPIENPITIPVLYTHRATTQQHVLGPYQRVWTTNFQSCPQIRRFFKKRLQCIKMPWKRVVTPTNWNTRNLMRREQRSAKDIVVFCGSTLHSPIMSPPRLGNTSLKYWIHLSPRNIHYTRFSTDQRWSSVFLQSETYVQLWMPTTKRRCHNKNPRMSLAIFNGAKSAQWTEYLEDAKLKS